MAKREEPALDAWQRGAFLHPQVLSHPTFALVAAGAIRDGSVVGREIGKPIVLNADAPLALMHANVFLDHDPLLHDQPLLKIWY